MSSTGIEDDVEAELALYYGHITRSIDRLIDACGDLPGEALAWRPPAPEANSLGVLATHVLGNAEENLLGTLCGQAVARDRDAEFEAAGVTLAALEERWRELRGHFKDGFERLEPGAIERVSEHPRRGPISGREVLLVVARHCAEHAGQAELTRDLYRAAHG